MKNVRQGFWILALAVMLTTFGIPTLRAQSQEGLEHGRGHNKDRDHGHDNDRNDNAYNNNARYQQGMNEGQNDRQQNRPRRYRFNSRNDQDRQAYQAGYDRG